MNHRILRHVIFFEETLDDWLAGIGVIFLFIPKLARVVANTPDVACSECG